MSLTKSKSDLVVPEPPLTSRETPSSKRRGSADLVESALGRLEFRAVSTDIVRTELSSHDVKTHKIISLMMPELPKKGSGSTLSFNVGDYAIHHLLGKGGSGSVYLGSHLRTKELVAAKMVDRKKSDEKDDVKDGIAEFKILSMLKHKHIVKVLHAEENERRVCLVLEYAAKGDLTAHIRSQPAFAPPASSSSSPSHSQPLIRRRNSLGTSPPIATRRKSGPTQRACYEEGEARRMFKQLLSAVHYTHLQGYVHRDIKPENVLVDKDNNVLLCDFSLATTWNPRLTRAGSCGTLHYAAPEVLAEKNYTGPEVDIWSCGAVLYFMLSGEPPFQALNDLEVVRNIKKGRKKALNKKVVSRAGRNLVDRMLEPNPLKRITMMDILNHEWFLGRKPEKSHNQSGFYNKGEKQAKSLGALPAATRQRSNSEISSTLNCFDLISERAETTSRSTSSSPTSSRKKKSSSHKRRESSRGTMLFSIKE